MFFKNSTKKLIARKQIFQLTKKRSKSQAPCIQPSDAEWVKMHANMNSGGGSWLVDKDLAKDSKNELQALQNQGGNKIVSDKELDIKIYNEKTKKKEGIDEELIQKSTSKIINKLSGSSIIIVYENSVETKASSQTSLLEVKESRSSGRVVSNLANHQHCSGDVSCTGINITSSLSSKKSLDAELSHDFQSCTKNPEKKIVIQCCSSKKDKSMDNGHEHKKQKTRMKLIPPEELSEPKCVKIVKRAVNSDADLTQDLSNMMTGGQLMKTLNSFLGADQSNYVEIIQKMNSSKKHKILLFKRQIEKCKKCREEEFSEAINLKPESNIIRLTVKRTKKKNRKSIKEVAQKPKDFNSLHLSEKSSTIKNSCPPKTDEKKPDSLKKSVSPASDINVLVASTLNELTGVLNVRNNSKSDKNGDTSDKASVISEAGISDGEESAPHICYERKGSQNSDSESQVRTQISDTPHQKTPNLDDNKSKASTNCAEENNSVSVVSPAKSVSVVCPAKSVSDKIWTKPLLVDKKMSGESKNILHEIVPSEELCRMSLDLSKGDCTTKEILDTSSSFKILRRERSKFGTDKNRPMKNIDNTLTISDLNIKNNSLMGFEAPETYVPNHLQVPNLQNDSTFLQFFDQRRLLKMGDNNFLSDPLMQSVKTGYYNLKKSYATTITLQRLASAESIQPVASSLEQSKVQSLVSSQMDLREEIISITTSEESVVSSSQISKKTIKPSEAEKHSYVEKNNDYLKLDFMNFDLNKQLDTLIAPTPKCYKHGKQHKERLGNIDDEKKKKKGTFWGRKLIQLSAPPCRMKKSNHRHCHKLV